MNSVRVWGGVCATKIKPVLKVKKQLVRTALFKSENGPLFPDI